MRKIHKEFQDTGQDIDSVIHCACGVSFRVYVPLVPYACPGCERLYEVKVVIEEISADEMKDNFKIIGKVVSE